MESFNFWSGRVNTGDLRCIWFQYNTLLQTGQQLLRGCDTCTLCILGGVGGEWASYQISKIAGTHAPGMPGTFSPSPQVNDPDMHRDARAVMHVGIAR